MNVPQERGLYWGKTVGYEWWNLIVTVRGEAPMLYISSIFDRYREDTIPNPRPSHIDVWGDMITDIVKKEMYVWLPR